jgi:hypothetical protein
MVLSVLLDDVRAPARQPPTREDRDERAGVEAQRLEHEGGVELDVRPQVAAGFHLVEDAHDGPLDGAG